MRVSTVLTGFVLAMTATAAPQPNEGSGITTKVTIPLTSTAATTTTLSTVTPTARSPTTRNPCDECQWMLGTCARSHDYAFCLNTVCVRDGCGQHGCTFCASATGLPSGISMPSPHMSLTRSTMSPLTAESVTNYWPPDVTLVPTPQARSEDDGVDQVQESDCKKCEHAVDKCKTNTDPMKRGICKDLECRWPRCKGCRTCSSSVSDLTPRDNIDDKEESTQQQRDGMGPRDDSKTDCGKCEKAVQECNKKGGDFWQRDRCMKDVCNKQPNCKKDCIVCTFAKDSDPAQRESSNMDTRDTEQENCANCDQAVNTCKKLPSLDQFNKCWAKQCDDIKGCRTQCPVCRYAPPADAVSIHQENPSNSLSSRGDAVDSAGTDDVNKDKLCDKCTNDISNCSKLPNSSLKQCEKVHCMKNPECKRCNICKQTETRDIPSPIDRRDDPVQSDPADPDPDKKKNCKDCEKGVLLCKNNPDHSKWDLCMQAQCKWIKQCDKNKCAICTIDHPLKEKRDIDLESAQASCDGELRKCSRYMGDQRRACIQSTCSKSECNGNKICKSQPPVARSDDINEDHIAKRKGGHPAPKPKPKPNPAPYNCDAEIKRCSKKKGDKKRKCFLDVCKHCKDRKECQR